MDEEDPFTTICTPAKGLAPAPSNADSPSPAPATGKTGLEAKTYHSRQDVWLTEPKAAAIPLNPRVQITNVKRVSNRKASFVVSISVSHNVNF